MTVRLYYDDAFLLAFDAEVTRALRVGDRPAVTLDRTAFYPTSGGQVFDTGSLAFDGDTARVVAVAEAADLPGCGLAPEEVVHLLDTPGPSAGCRVRGLVDAARRRDHMQQHSGQHVISAAFVGLFDMQTVSFHMGDESCTIDLDTSTLTSPQAVEAERLANRVLTEDRPVTVRYATLEEARALGLRKLPALDKQKLRLIDVQDFDLCACGGTHVSATGQIGAILLRKIEKVRQGTRVEFLCGDRAVGAARRDFETLTESAAAFSSHIYELPQQVRKLLEDNKSAQKAQQRLLEELADLHAERWLRDFSSEGPRILVRLFADRDLNFIRLLAQRLAKREQVVALLASTAGQPALVFAQSPGLPHDMGAFMKQALAELGGRGGGARDLAQGGPLDAARIPAVLEAIADKLRQ